MKNFNGTQHGEVYLLPVKKVPKGESAQYDAFIVAHSETGHHHVLQSKSKFEVITSKDKQELYLRLFEPAMLVHQKTADKHRTLTVEPGLYRVNHKTEYSPWEKARRQVKD